MSRSARTRPAQRGLTLIELMIAVTIGLVIMLGLTVVFLRVKDAANTHDGLAQLQDDERMALTLLTSSIQTAAYFPDPLTHQASDANTLPAANTSQGSFAAGQGIVGTSPAAPASHTLTTRYVSAGGDGLMDCLGQTRTSRTTITNLYTVSAAAGLGCSVDDGTTTTTLISTVGALSVLYGTDGSGSGNADRYLTASAVTAASLWPRVKTARLTLTFANPFAGQAGQPATIRWVQTVNLMNEP